MFRPLGLAAALLVACGSDPPPTATAPSATSAQTPAALPVAPTADAGAPTAEVAPPADSAGPGNVGALGSADATWQDDFGNGRLRLGGGAARGRKVPTLRSGQLVATGRLSPEVISRIIRQSFGRFRLCYENGLRTTPSLEGIVTVKLVIDEKGTTKSAVDSGSTVPDASVVACFVKAYAAMPFPAPESGIVTATSPIVLSPGAP